MVSARRRLDDARRVAEARIREQAVLNDKAHDAILVQDMGHRVRYANPSEKDLFGWKAYAGLVLDRFRHHRGRRHINGIESFWSYARTRLAKLRKFHGHLKET